MIAEFNDVLLLVLGWLLGTLSPGVGRALLLARRRTELLRGLAYECTELRFTMASVLIHARSSAAAFDQRTLNLVKPIIQNYAGSDDLQVLPSLKGLMARGDAVVLETMNATTSHDGAWPAPYALPLLDAHIGELTLFPVPIQERLMRIGVELKLFNEQVAYVRHLVDRSFSASGSNYDINASNLVIAQRNLGVRAEMLIVGIDRLLDPAGDVRAEKRG